MAEIVVEHLYKSFGGREVLSDVCLRFPHGRVSALTGPSGAGKTTLLRILMGLETPDRGRVTGLEGARLGVVFQEDRLLERVDVAGNLRLMRPDLSGDALARALARFGLEGCEDKRADALSGGMRRRVALLRALLSDGEVLLLDEPFNGLDPDTLDRVARQAAAMVAGRTAVIVTHDPEPLRWFDARVFTLSDPSRENAAGTGFTRQSPVVDPDGKGQSEL